jgi:hypothetical protein
MEKEMGCVLRVYGEFLDIGALLPALKLIPGVSWVVPIRALDQRPFRSIPPDLGDQVRCRVQSAQVSQNQPLEYI